MASDVESGHSRYFVALDLGSESMAAYFHREGTAEGEMVDLQHLRSMTRSEKWKLLFEEDGSISRRLRTVITLRDGTHPCPLPTDHATLNLVPDLQASLFEFFHPHEGLLDNILPNPKIPFQYGSKKIIPDVLPKEGIVRVRHSPEQLIQHITMQVVNNFVLASPQLRDVPRASIHLTLTVPNVYSLAHAESVRRFVEEHGGLERVDVLYESDALAYFPMMATHADDSSDLKAFKERRVRRRKQEELRIFTVDIGRGTSDLSLIQMRVETQDAKTAPEKGHEGEHILMARTGSCEGGNTLTYLFVQYYSDLLSRVFHRHNIPQLYDFVSRPDMWKTDAYQTSVDLNTLIESVKRSITADYVVEMNPAEQKELLEKVLDPMLARVEGSKETHLAFRDEAIRLLTLTGPLPSGKGPGHWWRGTKSRSDIERERYRRMVRLRKEIEDYVSNRIHALIFQLREAAAERQKIGGGAHSLKTLEKRIFDPSCTFAIVAGQASQFAPLRTMVADTLERMLPGNVLFLKGRLAKEACCRGAVAFHLSKDRQMNPEELFGTYALMAAAPLMEEEQFKPVNMRAIATGGVDLIKVPRDTTYWFVYSPKGRFRQDDIPKLFDGTIALLTNLDSTNLQFRIQYDPQERQLAVNWKPVGLANFGDINESIYPKVWPEVARTVEKNHVYHPS